MCGRFASFLPAEALRAIFRTVNPPPNFPPSWNLAPSQEAAAVRVHPDTRERHLDLLRWGLIPHSTTDLKGILKPINARSETAGSLSVFRGALAARRCLVPANAFYEWQAVRSGSKQPYAIARQDGEPLAFAGIWEGWLAPDGNTVRSFAILTTAANPAMAMLHNRMPVIIEEPNWPAWLGEAPGDLAQLMRPAANDMLRLWPVSSAVNNVRNNEPHLLDALDDLRALPPSYAYPGRNPA